MKNIKKMTQTTELKHDELKAVQGGEFIGGPIMLPILIIKWLFS
jgi:hypothetical protein